MLERRGAHTPGRSVHHQDLFYGQRSIRSRMSAMRADHAVAAGTHEVCGTNSRQERQGISEKLSDTPNGPGGVPRQIFEGLHGR